MNREELIRGYAAAWGRMTQPERDQVWAWLDDAEKARFEQRLQRPQTTPYRPPSTFRWTPASVAAGVSAVLGLMAFIGLVIADGGRTAGSRRSSSASPARSASRFDTRVPNAAMANPRDLRDAYDFVRKAGPACEQSSIRVDESDRSVVVTIACDGNGQSVRGGMRLKDGVVREVW